MIVGKCDAPESRQVSTNEGEYIARLYNAVFMESSAKTRINMEEIVYDLVR